jgi:N utilization substance protein B
MDAGATAAPPVTLTGRRRDVRRLAMQLLYQMDVTGELDRAAVLASVDEEHDKHEAVRVEAVDLALGAWVTHGTADERIGRLAPDWPTHRQPPVDRAILRLAHHELATRRVPVKVAINEAVELAKQYCAEQSPMFINGVLDRLASRLDEPDDAAQDASSVTPDAAQTADSASGPAGPTPPAAGDAWLADALRGPGS